MHHSFSYKPPGPVAREFVRCDSFVSAIMGPIGSGKSTASVARLTANAFRQPSA
jgi:pantothenate kinase-related protein Tda10